MHSLLIFITVAAISFIGSLQLGPVNSLVMMTAIEQKLRPAIIVAIGGIIPELLYSAAAIWLYDSVKISADWSQRIEIVLGLVLTGIGLWFFFKPERKSENKPKNSGFGVGLIFGMLNPQLLPFWTVVLLYLNTFQSLHVQSQSDKVAFVLGSAIGAFLLLVFIAALSYRLKEKIIRYVKPALINKILGMIFVILGITKLVSLLHLNL